MKVKDLIETLLHCNPRANVQFTGQMDKGNHNFFPIETQTDDLPKIEKDTGSLVVINVGYFQPEE